MSKRETPMTRQFWQQTGGLLVEEFAWSIGSLDAVGAGLMG